MAFLRGARRRAGVARCAARLHALCLASGAAQRQLRAGYTALARGYWRCVSCKNACARALASRSAKNRCANTARKPVSCSKNSRPASQRSPPRAQSAAECERCRAVASRVAPTNSWLPEVTEGWSSATTCCFCAADEGKTCGTRGCSRLKNRRMAPVAPPYPVRVLRRPSPHQQHGGPPRHDGVVPRRRHRRGRHRVALRLDEPPRVGRH